MAISKWPFNRARFTPGRPHRSGAGRAGAYRGGRRTRPRGAAVERAHQAVARTRAQPARMAAGTSLESKAVLCPTSMMAVMQANRTSPVRTAHSIAVAPLMERKNRDMRKASQKSPEISCTTIFSNLCQARPMANRRRRDSDLFMPAGTLFPIIRDSWMCNSTTDPLKTQRSRVRNLANRPGRNRAATINQRFQSDLPVHGFAC